jgi:hypothetical protein
MHKEAPKTHQKTLKAHKKKTLKTLGVHSKQELENTKNA